MPVMTAPFGKFSEFLAWAREEHGCDDKSGVMATSRGMETFTKIEAPSGRRVVVLDLERDESIPRCAYNYYTRRLGLPDYDVSDSPIEVDPNHPP